MIMTKSDYTVESLFIRNREFLRKNEHGFISWLADSKAGFVIFDYDSKVYNELEDAYSVLTTGKRRKDVIVSGYTIKQMAEILDRTYKVIYSVCKLNFPRKNIKKDNKFNDEQFDLIKRYVEKYRKKA